MASILFGRKTKSAVEFRTDQAIPEIKFARTTTVDKPVTKPSTKRNFTETIVIDSDDDDATEQFSKRQSKGSTVASGGEGDLTDAHQAEITERLKALSSATGTSKDEPVDLNVASPVAKDELFDKTANELKQKLKKSRSVNSSNTSSQVTQPVVEVDLDDEPIFVAPTVMPGSARVLTAPSRSEVDDLSISRLQQLRGARATTLPVPSSSSSSKRAAAGTSSSMSNTDQNKCRLRTRLNGRHTRDWKFGFDENFAKLKAEVAAVYGVQPKKLTLEFDGDNLADNDTARGLGMEHDFMIDVKIDKALYEGAVRAADSYGPPSSGAGAPSAASAAAAPGLPQVKIKTRLNGRHERKWKICATEPFEKVRRNLMSLYGITDAKQLALEFDGERVGDGQTPQSLGIEDDDLIEVKIDAALYERAIAATAAKR